jgi:hypothetical protein
VSTKTFKATYNISLILGNNFTFGFRTIT